MVATRVLECGASGCSSRLVRPTSELPRAPWRRGTGRFRGFERDPRRLERARGGNPVRCFTNSSVETRRAPPDETWTARVRIHVFRKVKLKQSKKPGTKNTSRVASSSGDGSKPRHRGGRHRTERASPLLLFVGNELPRTPPRASTRARPFAPDAERSRLKNYSRLCIVARTNRSVFSRALRARFHRGDAPRDDAEARIIF